VGSTPGWVAIKWLLLLDSLGYCLWTVKPLQYRPTFITNIKVNKAIDVKTFQEK